VFCTVAVNQKDIIPQAPVRDLTGCKPVPAMLVLLSMFYRTSPCKTELITYAPL